MHTDIFIIGGGINGIGIARDAIGRGLSVRLAEQDDLGSATSSASTKLFHGGLRYLEHYEFRLVREALIEREILLNAMPHISWPMRFLLPLHKDMRPAWLIRLGLFMYDHLGGRKILPPTRSVALTGSPYGKGLNKHLKRAFEYSDCWVDDARLVVLNARDAKERGADILTRHEVISASRNDGKWIIEVKNTLSGTQETYTADVVINAAGPWVGNIIDHVVTSNSNEDMRLIKGSHIVVKKIFDHDHCYIFQNTDDRIFFAIPYENDFTLIGTTDVDQGSENTQATCSNEEIDYMCSSISEYLDTPLSPEDVVWTYSGIRPLYDDKAENASQATRDYVLRIDDAEDLPLLNIFGGKITTYRRLAESAIDAIADYCKETPNLDKKWTAHQSLPGGDFELTDKQSLIDELCSEYPFIDTKEATRLIRLYGTEAKIWLKRAKNRADLGIDFGHNLSEAEVNHQINHEFAMSTDDVLWRRTKLGLYFSPPEVQALSNWMKERVSGELK